jgi:hypothetical protein
MKRYIRANSQKSVLDYVKTDWKELEDESGITFTIYDEDDKVLFEAVFDYNDVDPDAIYSSAIDMAIVALSQKYELTEDAIKDIKGE